MRADAPPMELASPGFSVYLTALWPSPQGFRDLLHGLQDCVDYLEIGLPSASPVYDGPTIRRTHYEATRQGATPERALEEMARSGIAREFIVMAYMQEHLDRLERLAQEAARAGASSILMPDLPFEYPGMIGHYTRLMRGSGMEPSFFASPRFPHHLLRLYSMLDPLLVYLGLQPATGVRLPARMLDNIRLARKLLGDAYMLAGFSIRSGQEARKVIEAGASGVVVGSHIARIVMEQGVDAAVEEACRIHREVHEAGRVVAGRG